MDKNTIVVVWSDHGWHLGDYRVWGKHTIFDQAVRSVLIVKTPGMKTGLVRNEILSSVDIYPTLDGLMRDENTGKSGWKKLQQPPEKRKTGRLGQCGLQLFQTGHHRSDRPLPLHPVFQKAGANR
jgi:arylsulfatase A-like enzyme